MNKRVFTMIAFIMAAIVSPAFTEGQTQKPLLKDFMGINGHYTFKPELYRPTCRLVRNYHGINWDVNQPGDPITFPICANKVDWKRDVYGKWLPHGFEISLCAQFGSFGREKENFQELWKEKDEWIYQYGYEMAKYFGPSGSEKLCTSIEIGNEPGNEFDDGLYQNIFTHMAKGIRDGDPKIKIVTCTAQTREADKYSKQLQETFASPEIQKLFDVINLHVYAAVSKDSAAHPWERSYPEDSKIDYLKVVDEAIQWRDRHAPGKEIWITEFGWDSCTPEAMKNRTGWFEKLKWTGQTDLQQAQYLVRSFFCFAERGVDRAYIYFYDDNDKPSTHAASGLTRNFEPKISYWAVKHLQETLGEYRFNRIVKKEEGKQYIYEFQHGADETKLIWAAWSPTELGEERDIIIPNLPGKVSSITRMPVQKGPALNVQWETTGSNSIRLTLSGSPVSILIGQ